MNRTILTRRGEVANLPSAGSMDGELRWATDTKELYIDSDGENVLIARANGTLPSDIKVDNGNWEGTDLSVANGGTGASTLTDHGLLLGSGTDAVTALGVATNGQIPIGSTGADPVIATITAGNGIDVTNAEGSITVATDLKANGGLVIESTELAVDLGASSITGTLAVSDGGTGAVSLNDHGILIGSGTAAVTGLTALGAGELIYGKAGDDPVALAANTTATKKFLSETSSAPSWVTIAASDLPQQAAESVLANVTGSAAVPAALEVAEQRVIGRLTGGHVTGLTGANIGNLIAGVDVAGIKLGDGTNYVNISSDGVITLVGTAKRNLTLRPQMVTSKLIKTPLAILPTPVTLGAFSGFSMPIYNSDEEELYFRMRAPYRWDGSTNPFFKIIVAISKAEDVGDKFKFQLSWNNTSITGSIETDTVDVETETTIITDHSAQYSTYSVSFELDYDNAGLQQTMVSRNHIAGRLRRIAASSLEVSNEIYVLDWITSWSVDKIFGTF